MPNHAECSILCRVLCLNLCGFTWLSLVAVMTYCARLEHSLAARIFFQENNSGYFTIELLDKKHSQLKTIFPTSDLFLYILYLLIFWTSFPLDTDKSQCCTSVSFPLSLLHRHPLLCPVPRLGLLPGTDLALFAMTSCIPFPTLIPKSLPGELNSEYLVPFFSALCSLHQMTAIFVTLKCILFKWANLVLSFPDHYRKRCHIFHH